MYAGPNSHLGDESSRLAIRKKTRRNHLPLGAGKLRDAVGRDAILGPYGIADPAAVMLLDNEIDEMRTRLAIRIAPFERNLLNELGGLPTGNEQKRAVQLSVALRADDVTGTIADDQLPWPTFSPAVSTCFSARHMPPAR